MPKTPQEVESMNFVRANWVLCAGCACAPQDMPEGAGYDLDCPHIHVEVKGAEREFLGHVYFTVKEKEAASNDPKWLCILVCEVLTPKPKAYKIAASYVAGNATLEPQYMLLIGKKRLADFPAL